MPAATTDNDRAWYLIYTKPQQERRALENLERQGFEAFLPLLRTFRRRRGKRLEVLEPMFPRYLFVHLSEAVDNWAPIRSTLGVSRLVQFGGEPARAPIGLVRILQAGTDEAGVHSRPPRDYQPGEPVRIADGPFAGYEGVFQARSGAERVLLLLEIAGQTARLQIPELDLEQLG
ncbi:MAG TPA: transcription/translation regulatory transformer protein RfaH [Sedimenticola sp.]|nr:transcription/translation regulatory transformer protein RfaH [Sedimenticola sp.]